MGEDALCLACAACSLQIAIQLTLQRPAIHCHQVTPHPPPHCAHPFEPPSRRYSGVARTKRVARRVPGNRCPQHIIHIMPRFHALPSRMCLHDRHIISAGQGAEEQRRRRTRPTLLPTCCSCVWRPARLCGSEVPVRSGVEYVCSVCGMSCHMS